MGSGIARILTANQKGNVMLVPFTKTGPPLNLDPIICACNQTKQVREIWLVWTISEGESEPHYHPVCQDCWLRCVTGGNA